MVDANAMDTALQFTVLCCNKFLFFILKLHTAPSSKSFRGEGLYAREKEKVKTKRKKKKNLSRIHHSFDHGFVGSQSNLTMEETFLTKEFQKN